MLRGDLEVDMVWNQWRLVVGTQTGRTMNSLSADIV